MDVEVMKKHIELYVNEFTISLGLKGKEAVRKLIDFACSRKVIPEVPERIFLLED
jgi:1,4-dihydroxy-6-naphthoate synthase